MIKLILIELKKIFSKKSIYVIMVIIFLFNFLNNILFYTDYDEFGNYKYLENNTLSTEKNILEKELSKYDYNNKSDVSRYINLKTELDIIKLKENYKINSWQYNKIEDYLYNELRNVNIYIYQYKDDILLENAKNNLNILLEKLKKDDWKYFINLEIIKLENEQKELKERLVLLADKIEKENIEELINSNNLNLKILNYRINNNIKEDNNFLNNALINYKNNINLVKQYEENYNLTREEQIEYQNKKIITEESKYILKNKINYNKQNNLNYQLRTIVDDYEIFIIIIILIVASTIVAEEIQKGTIKLLLIKPYSRGKILLSKYLSIIIILILMICYLILIELIIGGIIFGYSSLEIPVIVYDFNKEIIIEYNIFLYMIIRIVVKMPMLLIIITISFSLSTIINNVALSITIPLLIYMFAPSINYLILHYKVNLLKYFVSVNWNFNNYLFGKIPEIECVDLTFSIIVCLFYFIAIIMFTYISFKKKNIRNV